MAAALAAGPAIGVAAEAAGKVAEKFEENPLGFIARILKVVGGALVVGGGLSYVVGYFAEAKGNEARQDAVNSIGTILASLPKVKAGGGWSWNPFQDVETLIGDFKNAFGEIADLAVDLPHALIAGTVAFPRILFDEAVGTAGIMVGGFLMDLGPILLLLGSVFLGLGYFIASDGSRAAVRIRAAIAKITGREDAEMVPVVRGLSQHLQVEEAVQAAAVGIPVPDAALPEISHETPRLVDDTPPGIDADRPAEPQQSEPQGVGGAGTQTGLSPPAEPVPEAPGPMDQATPAPPVETTPTERTEEMLGEMPNRAPTMEQIREMMAEAERNRVESMPPPVPRKPKVRGRDWAKMASEAFAEAES